MPAFKTKELEELSQRILSRAERQQQPLSALSRIRQIVRQKPKLKRL